MKDADDYTDNELTKAILETKQSIDKSAHYLRTLHAERRRRAESRKVKRQAVRTALERERDNLQASLNAAATENARLTEMLGAIGSRILNQFPEEFGDGVGIPEAINSIFKRVRSTRLASEPQPAAINQS